MTGNLPETVPVYAIPANGAQTDRVNLAPEATLAEMAGWARVPEHSVAFMAAMSGGTPMVLGNYLFFTGDDWITGVGYPLQGEYDLNAFILAADHLGDRLLQNQPDTAHVDMFVVAPSLPAEAVRGLGGETGEEDCFYTLPASAAIPPPLRRCVLKAKTLLRVDEGTEFTAGHRRLWAEMLARADMRPNVRAMYAKTGGLMLQKVPGLSFLNAWDAQGNLAAALLVDSSPHQFCSYIIGAHSRTHYSPHATDLLFAHLLDKARTMGKDYIHLGLGVNQGILRFKKKWGAQADLPFVMASWKHFAAKAGIKEEVGSLLATFCSAGPLVTKRQYFESLPQQRPYAMLWELEKNGNISWIGGTAHFFYYSFTRHFEKLFKQVDTVLFEGPMDDASMAWFTRSGQTRQSEDPDLLAMLAPEELARLKSTVQGSAHPLLRSLAGTGGPAPMDVEFYLANYRPWYAFFSLWAAFLERQGWKQSVDLEAWNLAHELGKNVVAMETHEEQMASLGSVPPERIINFFRQCHRWPAMSRNNMRSYLAGDLGGMYGTSTEFPTRGVHGVFSVRDQRFTERMMPFLERGRSITFVGSAHMLGMRHLLAREGVTIRKVFPSRWRRFVCGMQQKIKGNRCDFA